jgi:nucleoside-diphosphate-sugar epimerase
METVLVTGIAGNLGMRLLPQLEGYRVVGVDFVEPRSGAMRFHKMDLGAESSCHDLVDLIRDTQPSAIIHLAFVIDPLRTGVLDVDRMWQINVAGTARVMEAITEAQRRGATVAKFIFPSSVSAYGPDLPRPVNESAPLEAHTLPYAIHKRESDDVVRKRASSIEPCKTYILRPHIFVGASVQNYLVGSMRGVPGGKGRWAERLRQQGKRLPMMLPMGERYRKNRFQFVHVDDMARLLAHLVRRTQPDPPLTILNVAGRGQPISLERCAELSGAKIVTVPGRSLCRFVLSLAWRFGISDFPPEAFSYLAGEYLMDTTRLKQFLGRDYETVMKYTIEDALADSFRPASAISTAPAETASKAG